MTPKEVLAKHSKSFRLASRLLPAGSREDAAVVYAWCRWADDLVDEQPLAEAGAALDLLRRELAAPTQPYAVAFAEVAARRSIPPHYPAELVEGMAMDVAGTRYETMEDLLRYCWRVAGTVGTMMCHVMGLRDARALRNAAHLGIAMQLTNICRDVAEDWGRGRVYLPAELLPPGPPRLDADAMRPAVRTLLAEADRYYRSGDAGIPALGWRCALAVKTARLVYSRIGHRIARRGFDVTAGRAVVPGLVKLALVARALFGTAPRRAPLLLPDRTVRFPDDVLPV